MIFLDGQSRENGQPAGLIEEEERKEEYGFWLQFSHLQLSPMRTRRPQASEATLASFAALPDLSSMDVDEAIAAAAGLLP